ncbi:hypothetical protein FRB95_013151 [Tulasnella sp. JGI-2019a]|nr:hypothetical protein FRB95_013151 [Tulasnella sp. JGI-2019a]
MGTTGDATDSASSSYPASPATRFLDAALESSPPTTPSQTSSSEELSKTFVKPSALPRNLLQERIAMNLRLQTASSPRHSHTRSSSYSGWSSAATSEASPITPASGRSPSRSSVQSTASSIFDRMCGGSKSLASLAELYTEHKPSMGVFTPVSAKTASGSLRHLTVGRRGILSTLTFQYPLSSEEEEEGEDGAVSSLPRHRYQRLAARHHHGSLAPPPTVCLTSSSFQSPSPLDSEYPHPAESSASSQSQSQSPRSSTTATPKTPTSSRHPSIPAPWLNNSIIKSPSSSSSSPPNRRLTTPTTLSRGTHKKSGSVPISAMPALDPTLAALEKGCRLRSKVECVACGAVGWDFPKDRNGRAICSRECRMALKAQSAATGSTGEQITAPVLRVV